MITEIYVCVREILKRGPRPLALSDGRRAGYVEIYHEGELVARVRHDYRKADRKAHQAWIEIEDCCDIFVDGA